MTTSMDAGQLVVKLTKTEIKALLRTLREEPTNEAGNIFIDELIELLGDNA